jgi:hypothetical protein
MKIIKVVLIILVTILGLSAGGAKILLMPEEMKFFSKVGMNDMMLIVFGLIQLIGAILFIFSKTRKIGAIILAVTFGTSSLIILLAGKITFGLFSLLPIGIILVILNINQK